jgi:hypothetical protein
MLSVAAARSFGAELGGKPEKRDVVLTYAQPSGAFSPYLKNNPNTVYALLKATAEGVVMSRNDPRVAKKTIAKYGKIDDPATIDGTYDAFAPYWAMSLAIRPEAIRAQFKYLDEKEFPNAKNADPKDFFDSSFVDSLAKSGFLKDLGMK